jgi:glyoxylase-like metal-dependent hydrolase (beta-lactamase superfamily II)
MRYMLTGEDWDADEAFRMGLVQELTAPGRQLDRATDFAKQFAAAAPLAVRALLASAHRALIEGEKAALAALQSEFGRLLRSEDRQEFLRSLRENRAGLRRTIAPVAMPEKSETPHNDIGRCDFLAREATMRSMFFTVILLVLASTARAGEVDRLYVIDCGWAHASDQSLWSPCVNAGVPIDFADNCYLIHHSREGYLLWDTGITDRLAAAPDGVTVPALGQTWHRTRTLVAALAGLGVEPADVRYVAISHVHPDHAGNVDAFPGATLIIQKAEWDYAMTLPQKPFSPQHKVQPIEGDKDLFGDGSLVILISP